MSSRSSGPASSAAVYHVLNGAISPIDGVGPDRSRSARSSTGPTRPPPQPLRRVIIATNPTLEGEATAMYLDERLAGKVGSVTRIARGIPVGGDLEYADEVTLIRASRGGARSANGLTTLSTWFRIQEFWSRSGSPRQGRPRHPPRARGLTSCEGPVRDDAVGAARVEAWIAGMLVS